MRKHAVISILFVLAGFSSANASENASDAAHLCRFFVSEHRIDSEAASTVTRVFNHLATEFADLEKRASESEDDIDVVETFDAKSEFQMRPEALALAARDTESRLSMVSLSDLDDHDEPVSYGVRPKGN